MQRPRRRIGWIVGLAVAALVAVGLVVGLSRNYSSSDLASRSTTSITDFSVGVTLYDANDRVAMPNLTGTDLEGSPLRLSDYPGQILVLNLWGSWCGPCRAEAPDLAAVSASMAGHGVQFIGVDTKDNPASARSFERHYGIAYPSFDDSATPVLAEFPHVVPLSAIPSTVVVDPRGEVAAAIVGRVDASTLRGIIEDLQAESTSSPASSTPASPAAS